MRHLRLLLSVAAARFRSELAVDGASRVAFRVWPTDIDVSIANNAAFLTILETGRIDFMIRSGFFALARRHRWYFPLAGIHVRFLRPLKVFQRAELTTSILYADDEWIYLAQTIVSRGRIVAKALVKGTVRKGRARVPLDRITTELGVEPLPRRGREIAEGFGELERLLGKVEQTP